MELKFKPGDRVVLRLRDPGLRFELLNGRTGTIVKQCVIYNNGPEMYEVLVSDDDALEYSSIPFFAYELKAAEE